MRLMPAVSHALWEREDEGLMILPASVPDSEVREFRIWGKLTPVVREIAIKIHSSS